MYLKVGDPYKKQRMGNGYSSHPPLPSSPHTCTLLLLPAHLTHSSLPGALTRPFPPGAVSYELCISGSEPGPRQELNKWSNKQMDGSCWALGENKWWAKKDLMSSFLPCFGAESLLHKSGPKSAQASVSLVTTDAQMGRIGAWWFKELG